jgi:membrane protein
MIKRWVLKSAPYTKSISYLKGRHFTKRKVNLYIFFVILLREIKRDSLVERAKSMAFSFMLSMFPSIICVFTLIPYIPIPDLNKQIMEQLNGMLPTSIYTMINDTIFEIVSIPHGGLLSFGFAMAIYSATNGIMAMKEAFQRCYSTSDRRPFWKKLLMSLMLIFLLGLIILVIAAIIIFLEIYIHKLPLNAGLSAFGLIFLKYALVFLLFYLGISVIYYIAPAVQQRWNFFSHGSFIATLLIGGFTYAFTFYVNNFNSYNKVYGSIGALIGLMLWFYATSLMLLIGFEINACIDIAHKEYYRKKLLA